MCKQGGRIVAAELVDHIIPHRGDQKLFWDQMKNWQALCELCHRRKTAREVADRRRRGGVKSLWPLAVDRAF
ncbi:MAG: HNH endonuclease signature motif containing protein [Pseudonocardiaceae bacterium]